MRRTLPQRPERAAAFIRLEQEKWGRVIQEVGIKLN